MNPRKSLKESTGRSRPSYPFDRATAEDKNIYLRYNNKKKTDDQHLQLGGDHVLDGVDGVGQLRERLSPVLSRASS